MITEAPAAPERPASGPAVRRSLPSRVSSGHVFMVVAGLLAFLTNLVVLRGGGETVSAAVAAVDLSAGTALSETEVRYVEVDPSSPLAGAFLTSAELAARGDEVLTSRVAAGDPLLESSLASPAAARGKRAIAVPIGRERSVGGALRPGDRIDLIAVDEGVSRYVLVDAEVLAVPLDGNRGLSAAGGFFVVVAVDAAQALDVARSAASSELHVVRSTGADPAAVAPRENAP